MQKDFWKKIIIVLGLAFLIEEHPKLLKNVLFFLLIIIILLMFISYISLSKSYKLPTNY